MTFLHSTPRPIPYFIQFQGRIRSFVTGFSACSVRNGERSGSNINVFKFPYMFPIINRTACRVGFASTSVTCGNTTKSAKNFTAIPIIDTTAKCVKPINQPVPLKIDIGVPSPFSPCAIAPAKSPAHAAVMFVQTDAIAWYPGPPLRLKSSIMLKFATSCPAPTKPPYM